jgi:hypothetical protein
MGVTDGSLMFQCECDEPKIGKVIRSVYRVEFTPQNLEKLYEKAKQFKHIMGWEIPSYEHFISFFLSPVEGGKFEARGLCARIDDFIGIFWLTDINYTHQPFDASIHYTFFDRRHKGRLDLCKEAIRYVFDTYQFERLWTTVPVYMYQPYVKSGKRNDKSSVMQFVEEIGFKKEGRLKNKAQFKGQLFDSNLYALTKDEVLSGRAFSPKEKKWVAQT